LVVVDANAGGAVEAVVELLAGEITGEDEESGVDSGVGRLADFAEEAVLFFERVLERVVIFDQLVAIFCLVS
jgi:hypothetical protein